MTHPAQSPKTERWLDDLGVSWEFHPDLPLHRIDQAASLANQVRHQPLDEEVVERYANDMRQGDVFPAAVVSKLPSSATGLTEDRYAIAGGNHRYAASERAGRATIAAYVITTDPTSLLRIRVEDNRNHGLPTTKAERLDHGVALTESGLTQREAARIVGLPQPDLTIHAGAIDVARRLAETDCAERVAKLPKTKRYELSRLADPAVLEAAASLTVDAGLPIDHVRALVDQSNAADDTHEALRLVGQLREDHHDRIVDQAGNARAASRTARAQLDQALTIIRSLDPEAVFASCPNDDVRAVLADRIMGAAGVLMPCHELLTAKVRASGVTDQPGAISPTGRKALTHLAANAEADRRTHRSAIHQSAREALLARGLIEYVPSHPAHLQLTAAGQAMALGLAA